MENASKALIIAGAILLSIVIISLGLVVVNNVRDTIDNTNMNQQEIEAFNGKFTAYAGDKVIGSKVNALMSVVTSSNADAYKKEQSGLDEQPRVKVKYGSTTYEEDTSGDMSLPSFKSSKYYKVEFSYTNGIVTLVTIEDV